MWQAEEKSAEVILQGEMEDSMKGDHIYVDRGLYTHHGIELMEGKVIHYSGEPGSKEPGRIVASTLGEFLRGGKRRVCRSRKSFSREEVVRRALSRLGEEKYNLVTNNCEHFATWCRTGRIESGQVSGAVRTIFRTLFRPFRRARS